MRWVCRVDEDQLIMFKTLASLRNLGIRGEMQYDIEFPTKNQLKVFLAKKITKYRMQIRKGIIDSDSKEH